MYSQQIVLLIRLNVLHHFKELRGAYGIGGSAITPFGPISVYVAIPFNNGPLDRVKRFEFTVGNKF